MSRMEEYRSEQRRREMHDYEMLQLQRRQTRAVEGQENWLQTLMGYIVIAVLGVAYVTVCLVLLAIKYWYMWIPAVIVMVTVAMLVRRMRGKRQERPIDPILRPMASMEYMRKEMAGTEFADLYTTQGRGCKEPR